MKKFITAIICVTIILFTSFNINKISDFLAKKIDNDPKLIIEEKNAYAKGENYDFVKINEDYIPYSYNDLLNIIYTVIDNGWDSFTFYCSSEYEDCLNDMEQISNDDITLTHLNNFVSPFNSFTNLKTKIYESGEITINVSYMYTDEQIQKINAQVDSLLNSLTSKDASTFDNIKNIHDYIINNTKYDIERNENGDSQYESYNAYGALFDHYATCNGYTDLMAIFLDKLNVKNYKIATTQDRISYKSTGHIWNAVYLDGAWLHLDLTWDDPVSDDGKDNIYHKYFLVTNEELKTADTGDVNLEEHNFDNSVYLEFNDSINSIISE